MEKLIRILGNAMCWLGEHRWTWVTDGWGSSGHCQRPDCEFKAEDERRARKLLPYEHGQDMID